MAPFDDLPADQKAVLQLVLRQGRTYDEIAGLLKISPEAVRDRALTALDKVGPADAGDLTPDDQDAVGDYLLGQQGASARQGTRELLERSAAARGWARTVAGELRGAGVAGEDALPEIPADETETAEAFDALEARQRARADQERSSKLGGVLLLGALGIAVAALIIIIINVVGGDDNSNKSDSAATGTQTTQTTSTTGTGTPGVQAQINLRAPAGSSSKALGVVTIVTQNSQRAIAVVGQGLAPSGHYVLWLRNGAKVKFLGFFPPVTNKGSSAGRLQGLVAAPADLESYKEILVSREPSDKPTQPTAIALQGTIGG